MEEMSAAELQVMRVLWAWPNSTSAFIIDSLAGPYGWQPATIKTLLGRLKKKGLLTMIKDQGKYRYQALVDEETQILQSLEKLQASVCNTKQVDLVTLLLEKGEFSRSDLQKITELAKKRLATAPDQLACTCLPGQCTCGHTLRHSKSDVVNSFR